jgi:hypothetical protein
MKDLTFEALSPDAARELLVSIERDMKPIEMPLDKTLVQVAALPFYADYKFYAMTDMTLPPPNIRYMLYRPGDLNMMNWTNEPIYSVNEKAPIKLDRKTLVLYTKFFFHYVRGQLGRFIIVESPEEVRWLENASEQEKAMVAERLMPVTYKSVGRDNLFTLTCTVIFKNALFKTDVKVAPYEMDVFDPESGVSEHFTIGQMKLTNEELLLEDLNVPIDEPPGEFG